MPQVPLPDPESGLVRGMGPSSMQQFKYPSKSTKQDTRQNTKSRTVYRPPCTLGHCHQSLVISGGLSNSQMSCRLSGNELWVTFPMTHGLCPFSCNLLGHWIHDRNDYTNVPSRYSGVRQVRLLAPIYPTPLLPFFSLVPGAHDTGPSLYYSNILNSQPRSTSLSKI